MTNAIGSQGTLIAVSPDPNWPDPPGTPQGGAVTFVDIAELHDIKAPTLTRKAIETTSQNQLDDRYIVGVRRHGEMQFMVHFIPTDTTHDEETGLQKKWLDGSRDIYRLTYPDGSAWLFSGFIVGFEPDAKVDDKLTANVLIRPTGKHDWSAS